MPTLHFHLSLIEDKYQPKYYATDCKPSLLDYYVGGDLNTKQNWAKHPPLDKPIQDIDL